MRMKFLHFLHSGVADQNILGMTTFLPTIAKLAPDFFGYNTTMEYFGAPLRVIKEIIQRHIDSYVEGEIRDVIDAGLAQIYKCTDPDSVFFKDKGFLNLEYTVFDIFFAGSDTISSTLGWAFMYLAIWPEIQDKVVEEIQRVVGNDRAPCVQDRDK